MAFFKLLDLNLDFVRIKLLLTDLKSCPLLERTKIFAPHLLNAEVSLDRLGLVTCCSGMWESYRPSSLGVCLLDTEEKLRRSGFESSLTALSSFIAVQSSAAA